MMTMMMPMMPATVDVRITGMGMGMRAIYEEHDAGDRDGGCAGCHGGDDGGGGDVKT